jgi:hypothetical protein
MLMNYLRCWCALSVALAFFQACPTWAQPAKDRPNLGANAAMKYWQAFEQMPHGEDAQKLLEQWNTVPLDDPARKLIDKGQVSLVYLHRGASLERCDWSLDYEDGPTLLMPHLAKSRDLARLACLRARLAFKEGRQEAGVDDCLAVLMLARHNGNDRTMLSILVSYVIEQMPIDLLAAELPKLDAVLRRRTTDRLAKLPPVPTPAQCLQTEKQAMLGWLIAKLKTAEQNRTDGLSELTKMFTSEEEAREFHQKAGSPSPTKMIELLNELNPAYDEMSRIMSLPRRRFDGEWKKFHDDWKSKENPFVRALLPALDKLVAAEHRCTTRMAMFQAALAVVDGGPERAKSFLDPFGEGPFEYRPLPGGFELRSRLVFKAKPVTLMVGSDK